ncbi:MAG TPA: hypothetical protein VEA61_13530 [Allosphingosinicella sp.]|nr:hypothetical protein [Allosphingosinicella sp.]
MTDAKSSEQVSDGEGAATIPNLQGSIYMSATGGSHTSAQVGGSPAAVDWTQGPSRVSTAQFILAHMPRVPPPPPPLITDLTVGDNSIPIFGSWYSAAVTWTYAGDTGAATFSWKMGGLPTGPTGWNLVSDIIGPQKGNFDIAFATQPTSCLLSFQVTPSQAFMGPQTVLVYVDGQYVGALADGTQVVIKGTVVTIGVDFRAESFTDLQVGYTLQYQW